MPQYFQKPENALKRANEFIDIGKKEAALDVLYDVIKSKKHRNWQKIHEPILRTYLELCIDLKRSVNAKEGLYQYKLICQQVNILSLEEVISYFLKQAEKHADEARNQSIEIVTVEDLDQLQTPEGILLSSVSSENTQDRSDRVLLTPWVKFLWEAYRNVLELLRNNNRVEKLYHETAENAFKFCLKYMRKAEFRKLCVLIKNHLDQVLKYQGQPTAINLNNQESLQMHLETRLFQLKNAITMELWQEAFRAIEGIHYLMQMSKKLAKPHMMADYFEKVALVFFKANNNLFHAATLLKLFTLTKEQKKSVTQEELQKIGSKVLLATLSIKLSHGKSSMEEYLSYDQVASDKERRLAGLLGLISLPTRKSLIKDVENNIIPRVSNDLKDLFETVEKKFDPLNLCKKVDVILSKQSENSEHVQYIQLIQDIAVVRTLQQIGQVYETLSVARLLEMIPFVDNHRLERIIVNCVKFDDMQVTINHQTKSVSFGSALVVALKEEVVDGPFVQAMPSEILRSQLSSLSDGLKEAILLLNADNFLKENRQMCDQLVAQYLRQERKEHMLLLNRKSIIEARKERIENLRNEQERYELEQTKKQKDILRIAEEKRLEIEREKREKERRIQEMKEIQMQQVWDRVESLRGTDVGKRAFKNLSAKEINEMDPDDILQRQYEQLDREKRDLALKLRTQEKRVDYLVRAMRVVEVPILQKHFAEKKIKDEEEWNRDEEEAVINAKKEHEIALKAKGRFHRMQEDKETFLNELFGHRHVDYQNRLEDFEKNLEKVRQERLEARRKQRVAQRRQEFIREKREQKRKEREEQLRREKEAEEEKQRQEAEKKRIEDEEKQKALDEVARKQREREEEAERKWKEQQKPLPAGDTWRNDESNSSTGRVAGGKYIPPSRRRVDDVAPRDQENVDGGSWRRDGFQKRDEGRDDNRNENRNDNRNDWRDDRFSRRDDRRDFERRDDRFERRDERRDFERRDDRFERRDDRGGGDMWRRDDRGGRGYQDRGDERYNDSGSGGYGGRSGGWRGEGGNQSGGSWRSGDGGRSEGRSWQASRVRSDRDREDRDNNQSQDGWTTVR